MQKLFILIIILSLTKLGLSQNIGIGTGTPGAKLQINHRTTVSSPTLRLFDSTAGTGSRLVFARESMSNNFTLLSTIDLFAANSSLDIRTTLNSGIFLRGDGKVGINNITSPTATLHVGGGVKINDTLNVTGDVNIAGKLKINNDAGTAGQVLVSQGTGNSPEWAASSFPANERAWLIANTSILSAANAFGDTIDLNNTDYNTSSASFNFTNNTIIINKTGLYRFEGVVSIITGTPSTIIRGHHHTCDISMFDDNINIPLADENIFETDAFFSGRKIRFSVDRYINAGSVICLFAYVKNITPGGSATIQGNEQTYLSFYLIAE